MSLYMVIEHFDHPDAIPVYRRFRERGRLAPPGLNYISSWVTPEFDRCYQVMETDNRALLDEWISNWKDITRLRGHPRHHLKGSCRDDRPTALIKQFPRA